MNNLDKQYIYLLKDILENGTKKTDRTGTGTISVFGRQIRHKMSDGFPLITTKKMFFKGIVTELLWFLRGDTNIKYLVDNDCHIWDGDAYKNYCKNTPNEVINVGDTFIDTKRNIISICKRKEIGTSKKVPILICEYEGCYIEEDCKKLLTKDEFINKIRTDDEFAKKWGELGPIYGKQWRSWSKLEPNIGQSGVGRTYLFSGYNGIHTHYLTQIDQIQNLINDLKTNPDSRRLMVSAWNVGEIESMVLPPCFTEDMMVACIDGYRKISEITENDLVLTEDSSYQKVYQLHETKYVGDLVKFKVFGNTKDIVCTLNHPFLVKDKGYINANELNENDYLAIPINKKSIIPSFDIWLKDNQYTEKSITTKLDNFDYWFLMGYFLGDGWLIDSKEEIYFTIKNEQTDLILPRLKNIIGLAKLNNSGVNCTKYVGKKKQVFEILSKFGKYADGKFIPTFIHDAPKEYIEQFIEGYLMADGCKTKDGITYTTVSESIAYGLQLLYAKLGIKASVYFQNRPKKTIIEGRVVNQKNTFSINVYKQKNKTKKYILDSDYLWVKIKEINKVDFSGYVYNISVENNHTYNVYNLINHNCHYGFQVYTRELSLEERLRLVNYDKEKFNSIDEWITWYNNEPNEFYYMGINYTKDTALTDLGVPTRAISLMWNQRSVDTPLGLPFNIASYGLLLEIIAKEVNMVPDELIGNLGDTHIYLDQVDGVKEQLGRDSYELPRLKILDSKVDDIAHYDINDIILEGYKSHPVIKFPLSN